MFESNWIRMGQYLPTCVFGVPWARPISSSERHLADIIMK